MASISLMNEENLKMKLKPHWLSFFHLYVIFALLMVWAGVIWQFFVQEWFSEVPFLYDMAEGIVGEVATAGVIWALGLIVAGFFSRHFFLESGGNKIFWLYIAIVVFGIGGMVAYHRQVADDLDETMAFGEMFIPALTFGMGFVGAFTVNMYRRSFTYFLTDARIVLSSEFLLSRDERQVRYNHIEDITLSQGIIGRLLGFGTVIPITGSGLGTGTEESIIMAGGGKDVGGISLGMAGGSKRSSKKTRHDPHYTLYGVPGPEKVRDYVTQNIHSDTSVEHLKRIEDLLGKDSEETPAAEEE